MSYVIQNFNAFKINTNLTFKSKNLLFFLYFNKILLFHKTLNFYLFNTFFFNFQFSYFKSFYKHFFCRQLPYALKRNPFNFASFYENNLAKSASFWIYFSFLKLKSYLIFTKEQKKKLIFYSFLFSFKVLNSKTTKFFYKSVFFFYMFINVSIWPFYYNKFLFYLNFFNLSDDSMIYPYYNGYFFNVYNF